jgi:hypothetical protein
MLTAAYYKLEITEKRDEFSVYGEHIANQL